MDALKMSILASNSFKDEKAAEDWFKLIENRDRENPEVKKAWQHANDGATMVNDLRHGTLQLNPVYNSYVEPKLKTVGGGLLQITSEAIIATFRNMYDEGVLDDGWMSIFAMDDLRTSKRGLIMDITNLVTWADYDFQKPIVLSPFMDSQMEKLEKERKGGGVAVEREALKTSNPFISANQIIQAMRFASEEHKATFAYNLIQACITTASGAGQVTVFATSIQNTLNIAKDALLVRNHDRGFALTPASRTVLISNNVNRHTIEAAMRTTNGDNGNNIVAPTNIQRVYTYNLAADFGLGGANRAVLVLPSYKNRWGMFRDLFFEDESSARTDSIDFIGQEYYNGQCDSLQFQVVNLA